MAAAFVRRHVCVIVVVVVAVTAAVDVPVAALVLNGVEALNGVGEYVIEDHLGELQFHARLVGIVVDPLGLFLAKLFDLLCVCVRESLELRKRILQILREREKSWKQTEIHSFTNDIL